MFPADFQRDLTDDECNLHFVLFFWKTRMQYEYFCKIVFIYYSDFINIFERFETWQSTIPNHYTTLLATVKKHESISLTFLFFI